MAPSRRLGVSPLCFVAYTQDLLTTRPWALWHGEAPVSPSRREVAAPLGAGRDHVEHLVGSSSFSR